MLKATICSTLLALAGCSGSDDGFCIAPERATYRVTYDQPEGCPVVRGGTALVESGVFAEPGVQSSPIDSCSVRASNDEASFTASFDEAWTSGTGVLVRGSCVYAATLTRE